MIYEKVKKIRCSYIGLSLIPSSAIMGVPMYVSKSAYYVPFFKKDQDKCSLCTEMIITDDNHIAYYLNYKTSEFDFNADKLMNLLSVQACIKDNLEISLIQSIFGEHLSKRYENAIYVYRLINK